MDERILGRDPELDAARLFLAGVPAGPSGLLFEGDVGIGKTVLWRAVIEDARVRGYRLLTCAAEQAEARLSFVGLGDLVGDVEERVLARVPAPQLDALETALVRRSDASRPPDPRAVALAMRSLVVELAQASPVVVALDDVQWLDAATARAVAFVARRIGGHPVGLLVTVRTPFAVPDPLGLERAFGDRLSRLRLGPLEVGALRVLLHARLGYSYTRPALERVAEAAGGNPLFALEIARAVGARSSLETGAPLPVPDSLRELVSSRIAGLSPAARKSLLAAAALSRPTTKLVEGASSPAGLEAAEEAGLVRVDGGRVAFTHPLYASAVYAGAASRVRRALHGRLAVLVSDPEERVRHLALAATGPNENVASRLEEVAGLARARGAWDSAGELLERARSLTPPDRPESARNRGVRAAEQHIHAGDRPRARALLEEILEDSAPGNTRAKALQLLAQIRYNEDSLAEATRLLEEALEQAHDPALEATLELTLAYVRFNHLGDFVGADEHSARGLTLAKRLGDAALLADALAARAMVDFLVGRGVDWLKVERSLALEDRDRVQPVEMRPSLIAALLKLYVGRRDEARDELSILRRASNDSGDESDLAFVLFWLAWLETQSGDVARAAVLSEEAVVHAQLTGSEATHAFGLSQRAFVNALLGEEVAARTDAANASEICRRLGFLPPTIWTTATFALLELSLGDAGAAWLAAAPMTEAVERRGVGEPLLHLFLPAAIEALIGLGDLERAERLLDSFEGRARKVDRIWALATGARCRGLLLAARNELDEAELALERALAEHARLEIPFERARTLFVQGQVRRRRRQRRAARESVEQALALFEQMGARLWSDRARDELSRLGARRASGDLTPAERRVVALAADGLANKEIAGALFVSVHTVEVHLSHAYAKLGVHSRSQLARRLAASA